MDAVSDTTKLNFNEVFRLPILEFLTYIDYVNYKRRKEEEQIRKMNAKYKR